MGGPTSATSEVYCKTPMEIRASHVLKWRVCPSSSSSAISSLGGFWTRSLCSALGPSFSSPTYDMMKDRRAIQHGRPATFNFIFVNLRRERLRTVCGAVNRGIGLPRDSPHFTMAFLIRCLCFAIHTGTLDGICGRQLNRSK